MRDSGLRPRPWWRKKRWAAALALWLLICYPLSFGPLTYANYRGWVSPESSESYARPFQAAMELLEHYCNWWA